MKHIKSRWSNNNDSSQVTQSQPAETSFNSVTFTNASTSHASNPIIISTHQRQISIEVRNSSLNVPDMTSPTDSFHSVVSTYPNDRNDGKVNLAYTGSGNDISTNNQAMHRQQNQSNQVFQQYWSWSLPWSNWNQREKIFLLVIFILSLCILSLTSVLSVVLQKNIQYRDMLFDKLGITV